MLSNIVRFWLILVLLIPSLCTGLFALFCLLSIRVARRSLNHHITIVLLLIGLICQVTSYLWLLTSYRFIGVWLRSPLFCSIWAFLDWGLYATQTILFAWATLERHILIFHDRFVSTRRKRFLVHYLPFLLLLCYCLVYYSILFFFPPCRNLYSNFSAICVYPCLVMIHSFFVYDMIVHQILPVFFIIFFSILLLLRAIWRKARHRQAHQWRKHRRMTVQLLSISLLYLLFSSPYSITSALMLCGLPVRLILPLYDYSRFLIYFPVLFFPFVSTLSSNEIRTRLTRILRYRNPFRTTVPSTQQNVVHPQHI